MVLLALLVPTSSFAGKKKKQVAPAKPAEAPKPQIDVTKLVWPGPPNIPRVRYIDYFAGHEARLHPADGEAQAEVKLDGPSGRHPRPNTKGT